MRNWVRKIGSIENVLWYWDNNHWTPAGARRVGARLRASGRYPFLF